MQLSLIGQAVGMFTVTNVDDLVLLGLDLGRPDGYQPDTM